MQTTETAQYFIFLLCFPSQSGSTWNLGGFHMICALLVSKKCLFGGIFNSVWIPATHYKLMDICSCSVPNYELFLVFLGA